MTYVKNTVVYWLSISLIFALLSSFSGCDPNNHSPTDHPCNFPDADTENGLRAPLSFKIIDKTTLLNLVDTTATAPIRIDSVKLYDKNFIEIEPKIKYLVDNWTFENLEIYRNVPFNDPQALLDLKQETFYLRTAIDDYDTISVSFQQCLILEVLFNNQSTLKPIGEPYSGGTSFYFLK